MLVIEHSKSSLLIGQTKIDSYLGYENLFMWITIVTVAAAFSLLVLKNKINNVIYK
ncbi:alkaline phosphatase domain protein [Francisella tularensis subsp. holarctica]|nr:alkaline phosphatase domain protein [Francisella tularensis subsp. holarctica]AJI65782.1 alkaline phosphatase domain protein [Francisella tularensis subsp. holarctica]AJI66776.1 alkaline phosphatase domain protein [Francisella tularensis subsp. holarctica]